MVEMAATGVLANPPNNVRRASSSIHPSCFPAETPRTALRPPSLFPHTRPPPHPPPRLHPLPSVTPPLCRLYLSWAILVFCAARIYRHPASDLLCCEAVRLPFFHLTVAIDPSAAPASALLLPSPPCLAPFPSAPMSYQAAVAINTCIDISAFTAWGTVLLGLRDATMANQCEAINDSGLTDLIFTSAMTTRVTLLRSNCSVTSDINGNYPDTPDVQTPYMLVNVFYQILLTKRGLLYSDQVLSNNGPLDSLVPCYATNNTLFAPASAATMVKRGNIGPLVATHGTRYPNSQCVQALSGIPLKIALLKSSCTWRDGGPDRPLPPPTQLIEPIRPSRRFSEARDVCKQMCPVCFNEAALHRRSYRFRWSPLPAQSSCIRRIGRVPMPPRSHHQDYGTRPIEPWMEHPIPQKSSPVLYHDSA